ncbi:PREDICTED: peroxisomal acyl-coenzyme A oxidase 3-like [Nicrophorus vespilloides]|uniref:Acyl-coenzyme A oxidase n=1 Tax=Nicrophorus vespilloides TaxID=110193 RepID=A0ABM1M7H2_NICVS|nr:PREDICTED: peroxisomal acyl-coenzyme A oxidase 3-like [Nicrophorus vespilloides]XP_017770522.1 PREDICTED: peroxisomal acyl-coenzyme A oxidase 3-like [Nicrophorus vespilloides]
MVDSNEIRELLPEFPAGPLDEFRGKASFDWRKLKLFLEPKDVILYKKRFVEALKTDPIFNEEETQHDEIRRISAHKIRRMNEIPEFHADFSGNLLKLGVFPEVLNLADPSNLVTFMVNRNLYTSAVEGLGTEKHQHLVKAIEESKNFGCFCMTEIGHGSDTKRLKTKATYDAKRRGFVLETPDFEAAKCWSGLLGQLATHAVVYAQLYTPDGCCHGFHQFVVQIRDERTLLPMSGIVVGDMGVKIGLNGVDNGYLLFDKYFVGKEALLNRYADVTDDGEYVVLVEDPKRMFGAALATLSEGRLKIISLCTAFLIKAVTIAVRYAAVRKQFGPSNQEEISIIEYQTHQHRLLPYLSAAFVYKVFSAQILRKHASECSHPGYGYEIHAISSAAKPVASWFLMEALNECRQACAGHGYLKSAELGDLRNDADANCTYEGENHVLNQQTSNFLLKIWPKVLKGEHIDFPLESINFLSDIQTIMNFRVNFNSYEEFIHPRHIIDMYRWLTVHLLKASYDKYEASMEKTKDAFLSKNDNQVYFSRRLTIIYINHYILQTFQREMSSITDENVHEVMRKVFALYALFVLEKHIGFLYSGGLFVGGEPGTLLRDSILRLCHDLKDDAVTLVDTIAPDDYLINSFMGKSDGKVYEHLQKQLPVPNARPTWWRELLTPSQSKL